MNTHYKGLITEATKARENSYSPYSKFKVGAAVLTIDDKVYTGCNIENAAYGPTICAERTAIFKAVSEGNLKFKAIAVACNTNDFAYAFPCGVCRQVMSEFFSDDTEIIVTINSGEYKVFTLSDLLPFAFTI